MRTYEEIWNDYDKWCKTEQRRLQSKINHKEAVIIQWARITNMSIEEIKVMIEREKNGSSLHDWIYKDWMKFKDERLGELIGLWRE